MKKTIVLGAVAAASVALSPVASAANPFQISKPEAGYRVAQADAAVEKKVDGKCGEAKCGAHKKGAHKKGAEKKMDGKCGEAKCGAHKKKKEASCGADKVKDGSCGAKK